MSTQESKASLNDLSLQELPLSPPLDMTGATSPLTWPNMRLSDRSETTPTAPQPDPSNTPTSQATDHES